MDEFPAIGTGNFLSRVAPNSELECLFIGVKRTIAATQTQVR